MDSLEALKAVEEGADRIELCAHLDEGGVSPSDQLLLEAVAQTKVPIRVMVRPRSGGFIYTNEEFQIMKDEILRGKKAGVEGVVLGVMLNEKEIDVEKTKILVDLARPMKSTFHRAFDRLENPLMALEQVIAAGADTLLTSGGAQSAEQGVEELRNLVKGSRGQISILAGGGIRGTNVAIIVKTTGIRAVHVGGALNAAQHVKEIEERVRFVRQELQGL